MSESETRGLLVGLLTLSAVRLGSGLAYVGFLSMARRSRADSSEMWGESAR